MKPLRTYWELLRTQPRYISYGFVHFFFSSLGQTFLLGIFKPYWLESLALSNQQFGNYYAVATVASATLLSWLGSQIDRFRLRSVSVTNGTLMLLFCAGAAYAAHPWLLVGVLFGLRLTGQGMMILIGATGVARYFDTARGKALSLASLGLPAGEALLPPLLIATMSRGEWQNGWWVLGGLVVLVFMPLVPGLIARNDPFQLPPAHKHQDSRTDASGEDASYTRGQVLRDPLFYLLLPVGLFTPFFITGLVIHQNMIAAAKGWSPEVFAQAFAGYGVVRILANLMVGPLIDRYRAWRVFLVSLFPMAGGLMLLATGQQTWVAWGFLMLAGLTASTSALANSALWAELYGGRRLGSIKSMAATLMVFSTAAAASVTVPWFASPERLHTTLWWAIAAILISSMAAAVGLYQRMRPRPSVV